MESSEIDVFVLGEQRVPDVPGEAPDDGEAASIEFEVHLADYPPEEGGDTWVVSMTTESEQSTFHDALTTGLVTELSRDLLDESLLLQRDPTQ